MERLILNKLLEWKNSPYRKPLILKGVRQVGKTWILKEFGRRYYENTAYFNFDENEEYKQFFETTKDVDRILQNLMLASGYKILPEKTLIIFDEVQQYPKARQSIKKLVKDGRFDYLETGSLISIKENVKDITIPSEERQIKMYPLDFEEFGWALNEEFLIEYIKRCFKELKPLEEDLRIIRDIFIYILLK